MPTLVVVPTYDEASNIAEFLRRLRSSNPDVSILIVDDNSPDGTAAIAEAMAKEVGNLTIHRREKKSGLGTAYKHGFRWGLENGYDVMVEIDADHSHDPSSLPDLLRAVDEGADLAIGSRYVPGGSIPKWSLPRRLLSRWGNRYAATVLGVPISDMTSGFRAYKANILRKVDLGHIRADGYGFQIEMAYRIAAMGGDVAEVPIQFSDRTLGKSKMSRAIVIEALLLVTGWAITDRFHLRRQRKRAKKHEQLS